MIKEMTPRQRFEGVLSLEVPDRVPIGDGLFQHWRFINHFFKTEEEGKWTLEEICRAVGNSKVDFAFDLAPSLEPHFEKRLGLTYQVTEWTEVIIDRPFRTVEEARPWIKDMIMEVKRSDPDVMWSFAGNTGMWGLGHGNYKEDFLMKQRWLKNAVLFHTGSPAHLDTCYMMAGMEVFSYLMVDDYGLLIEWFDGLCKHERRRVSRCADYELSPVACVYCDIASKTSLLFSPNFLKAEYFPRLKLLINEWHRHGVKVIYHSEGDITSVIPDIVGAGTDGINPLEPDILDIKQLRKDYPNLIFWGGIDNNEVLSRGTIEEVEQAVRDLISDAGSNGRLLLGSSGQIHPANKLENILAMFEFARKYGKYS
ncbi:MAG: hypothetical protein M1371_08360 [Actinobacteria bacterium]|nr:hypothetical protein [Actinomycetota bacterium]